MTKRDGAPEEKGLIITIAPISAEVVSVAPAGETYPFKDASLADLARIEAQLGIVRSRRSVSHKGDAPPLLRKPRVGGTA